MAEDWNAIINQLKLELSWAIMVSEKWNPYLTKECEGYIKRIKKNDNTKIYNQINHDNNRELIHFLAEIQATADLILDGAKKPTILILIGHINKAIEIVKIKIS